MEKILIPEDLQSLVYNKFKGLPLKNKLIVYSKIIHGNSFKPQDNDFFDLNRRLINKIYKSFIENLREETNGRSKTN